MLYTIFPPETVMDDPDAEAASAAPPIEIARPNGATLVVRPTGQQEGALERVISSDPNDYLDPSLQPGAKIRFQPRFM